MNRILVNRICFVGTFPSVQHGEERPDVYLYRSISLSQANVEEGGVTHVLSGGIQLLGR